MTMNGRVIHAVRRAQQLRFFSQSPTAATAAADSSGLFRLLTDDQKQLLDEQRRLVRKIRDVAHRVGKGISLQDYDGGELGLASPGAHAIDRTFLCCIAGEFNAGKSTLINALLGAKVLESGALPTTDTVQVLAYGGNDENEANDDGSTGTLTSQQQSIGSTVFYLHPSALLKDLTLIDTPGTNAVHVDHTKLTQKLLPIADIILFVTSADRPFPDSERKLLSSIQRFRKNLVIVLNKIDTLDTSGGDHGQKEKERVTAFVTEHSSDLLGARPTVIAVSARDALGAKSLNSASGGLTNNAVWKRSNFEELEEFLSTTLTDRIKVRSKLLNPLGVAEGILDDCVESLKAQQDELETDTATLRLLESQMSGWTLEMETEMSKFRLEVRDMLRLEGGRCRELIQRTSLYDQMRWTVFGDRRAFQEAWIKAVAERPSDSLANDLNALVREISDDIGKDPVTLFSSLAKASKEWTERTGEPGDLIIAGIMDERDILELMSWPNTSIGTDASLKDKHPRGKGTYSKILSRYVREKRAMSLETAIYKMTYLPAKQLGITNRGLIKPGAYADLLLLDPENIKDHATMENPSKLSEGILAVWVNGQPTFGGELHTGRFPGRIIRRGDQ